MQSRAITPTRLILEVRTFWPKSTAQKLGCSIRDILSGKSTDHQVVATLTPEEIDASMCSAGILRLTEEPING